MNDVQNISCPYCWQSIPVFVEALDGSCEYVEDCSVCCQPMLLRIEVGEDQIQVTARREND